jgi:hypothetical protein
MSAIAPSRFERMTSVMAIPPLLQLPPLLRNATQECQQAWNGRDLE